jgi:hypothetical protein
MSDTPETDAFFFRIDIDWDMEVEFAKKLERERDEAREELRDIRLNLGVDAEGYTSLLHAVCALQNERDEAKAQLRKILKNE